MKVGILAGGLGTRLQEETTVKPKPMVEVGGKPLLWHIMQCYAAFGYNEFIIALGYKSELIKRYFLEYRHLASSMTVCLKTGEVEIRNASCEDWIVHLLDTGLDTQTGGRIRRIAEFVGPEPFMLTYGDGVSTVNVKQLLEFHLAHKRLATVTAVRPSARFGRLTFNGNLVAHFQEKPQSGEGWINGGFFVLEPGVVDYIEADETIWEREPMERLAKEGQLVAYRHQAFWQCVDTMRDLRLLESLWQTGKAPWKTW